MKVVILHIPDGTFEEMEDLRYALSQKLNPDYEFIITTNKTEAIDKEELLKVLK